MSIFHKAKTTEEKVATPVTPVAQPVKEKEVAKAPAAGAKKRQSTFGRPVIVKPLVTEKATLLSTQHKYTFAVEPGANKLEIAKAISHLYNVTPLAVQVITKRGKKIRSGRVQGATKHWKKAIVTLKPEDKIQIYEGV